MAKNIILLLDTQNKSEDLVASFSSLKVSIEMIYNSNHLAQHLAVEDASAAVANIHHNDEFELLEHVSKISLTYPEVPIVLLLPEPIQPSLNWGPKVFALVKPVSAYSILKRLQFLNSTDFPYDGLLKGGMLLSLLDHCLLENKSFRITLNYNDIHTADLLIRDGQWVSLYMDDGLRNDKLLLPFAWENALYKVEETSNAEVGEFEISPDEYQKFRMELHSWLSHVDQLPDPLAVVKLNKKNLKNYTGNLPKKVKPILKLLDGKRDLFRVFLDSELRPFDTAQHLGYLYFSKILEVVNPENGVVDAPQPAEPPLEKIEPKRPARRSKELAAWIMDPLNAAKKLEEKLKKDIKESRKNEPEQKEFRPRRRTQPGLGKLIGLLSSPEAPTSSDDQQTWENVSSDERVESHEFAKSFVMTLGGDSELETDEENSIPISINEEITKKVENRGNKQSEKSGSFKVTYSNEGEIEAVKRVVTQELDIAESHDDLEAISVPAVIIEGEGEETELLQDYETQELQSGVIEFDFKEKLSKKGPPADKEPKASISVSEEPSPEAEPEQHSDAEVTQGPTDGSKPIDLLQEIKEIPKIHEKERRLSQEQLVVDPMRVTASKDALEALRHKRLHGEVGDSDDSSDTGLSPKYQKMLDTISKSDPALPAAEEPEESVTASGTYKSFDAESADFFEYEEPSMTHAEMETFENLEYGSSGGKKGWVIAIIVIALIAGAVWFFKFRGGSGKKEEPSDLKKNMAMVMKAPVMKRPVMKKPLAMKRPVMKKPVAMKTAPPVVTVDPTLALKKALQDKVEALYASHKKRRNRRVFKEMKKLVLESSVKVPRAMELVALVAFDYEGEVKFAERLARETLKLDKTRAEAWWVIGLLAYERGKKADRKEAFSHYFKLMPNDTNRRRLAEKMGFRP